MGDIKKGSMEPKPKAPMQQPKQNPTPGKPVSTPRPAEKKPVR